MCSRSAPAFTNISMISLYPHWAAVCRAVRPNSCSWSTSVSSYANRSFTASRFSSKAGAEQKLVFSLTLRTFQTGDMQGCLPCNPGLIIIINNPLYCRPLVVDVTAVFDQFVHHHNVVIGHSNT